MGGASLQGNLTELGSSPPYLHTAAALNTSGRSETSLLASTHYFQPSRISPVARLRRRRGRTRPVVEARGRGRTRYVVQARCEVCRSL